LNEQKTYRRRLRRGNPGSAAEKGQRDHVVQTIPREK